MQSCGGNPNPGTEASDSPRQPRFNNSVEAPTNCHSVKSSTRMLTFLAWRSYAEEAAANRQHLGMSSCAGDAVGCHRFFVRRTELSPAFGDTDM